MYFKLEAKSPEYVSTEYRFKSSEEVEGHFSSNATFFELEDENKVGSWEGKESPLLADYLRTCKIYVSFNSIWSSRNPTADKSPCVSITIDLENRWSASIEAFMDNNLLLNTMLLCKQSKKIMFEGSISGSRVKRLENFFSVGSSQETSVRSIIDGLSVSYY